MPKFKPNSPKEKNVKKSVLIVHLGKREIDLHDQIKEVADKHNLTMSAFAKQAIRYALDNME